MEKLNPWAARAIDAAQTPADIQSRRYDHRCDR